MEPQVKSASCHPERPKNCRGLCRSCYRKVRYGELHRRKRLPRPDKWCHPDQPYHSRGLCQTCWTKKWREKHPERARATGKAGRFRRALRFYGITAVQFNEMHTSQGGVCKICKRPPIGKTRLSIDHNHTTKTVRGLLCDPCNSAIGHFQEDPSILYRAIDYLVEWQGQ